MNKPPRGPGYASSIGLLAVVLGAFGFLYVYEMTSLAMLRTLAQAPRASLASPVEGPAVYAGQVVGPPDRRTPTGEPAAATWWWVERRKSTTRPFQCSASAQGGLALRDGGRTAAISFVDDTDVFVIGDTDTNDWELRHVVDVGPHTTRRLDPPPTLTGACAGRNGVYVERTLGPGVAVEVYGCYRDGALRSCAGAVGGVISVGSLREHRVHRAEDIREDFRLAAFVSLAALLSFGLRALLFGGTFLGVLTPRRRSAS